MPNVPDKSPATEAEIEAASLQSEPAASTEDAAPAEATVEAAEPAEAPESPRDRVARRFKEKRVEEIGEGGDQTPLEAAIAAETAAAAPAVEPVTSKPIVSDPIQKLKIDGREIELPLSEVIRIAQTNSAIEARGRALAEANLELSRVRAEIQNARTAPAADTTGTRPRSPTPPAPAPREHTGLDEAQLRDIAERITSGTLEESSEALRELAESIRPDTPAPVDVRGEVGAALAEHDHRQHVNQTVTQFAEQYPEIASDPELEVIAYRRTYNEMVEDLERAGVTPEQVMQLRRSDPMAVSRAHLAFHRAVDPATGNRAYPMIRDYPTVLRSVGDAIYQKFGKAPPSPAAQPGKPNGLAARTDLKRALTPQPRATTRAEPPAPTPAGGNPSAKAAVSKIAQLRNKGRGVIVQ